MMDIKAWLETIGEPVADTAFTDETPLPYIAFLDTVSHSGADDKNLIKSHSVTIERYSVDGEGNAAVEALLDAAAIAFTEEQQWLDEERCFMAVFDFEIIEKD